MTIAKINTQATEYHSRCIEALNQAIDAEPEAVFVLYRKKGNTHVRAVFMSRLEMMGALEAAKQEVWDAE